VNVLVLIHSPFAMWNIPQAYLQRLAADFPQHNFLHAPDDRQGLALIPGADVAFSGHVSRDQLAAAPRLQWIHSPAAGVGGMLYPEMLQRAVVITNSRGMAADTMAEHAIAVTLAMFRRLHVAIRRQAERRWAQDEISAPPPNRSLAGARVLVVGLGAIGGAAAARFAALGARVSGIRRRPEASRRPGVDAVVGPAQLETLLPEADVVLVAAPHTAETRHLIGARELSLMKSDALLVNVSRGNLVDETALAAALQAGRIGGAALDVFEHEPLAADSPLWALPNVLITPHTSGFRPDHWDAATGLFAENLRRFEAGRPLLNVVDKEAGY
jgi:phosphoglycerate dehydrogenase-like enzyme